MDCAFDVAYRRGQVVHAANLQGSAWSEGAGGLDARRQGAGSKVGDDLGHPITGGQVEQS